MQRENQERRLRSSMASLSLQEEISFSQLATPASCNRSSTLQNANNGRQPPNNNEGHEQPLQNSNTNSKNNKNLLSNRWQRSNLQQPPENIDSIRRANNRWQRSSLQPPENVNNNHNNIQRQNNHIQQPPESSSNSIPTANNPTAQALIELCGFEYGDRRKYAERAVPVEYMTHDTYKSRAEEIAQDGLLRAGQADSQKFDKDLAGPGAPPVAYMQASKDGFDASAYPRLLPPCKSYQEAKRRLLFRPETLALHRAWMFLVSVEDEEKTVQLQVLFVSDHDRAWCEERFVPLDPSGFSALYWSQTRRCWMMLEKTSTRFTASGTRKPLKVNIAIAANIQWRYGDQVSFARELRRTPRAQVMLIAPHKAIGHAYCPCLRGGLSLCRGWFHDDIPGEWMLEDYEDTYVHRCLREADDD